MTPLKQAQESAWSLLGIVAQGNAQIGKVVRVSELAPAFAARPSLNLRAGMAYAVGQGWIRDWGRAVVLTEKGLAATASLRDATRTAGATDTVPGSDRVFRSIAIPPRPAVKKPTVNRG